MTQIGEIDRTDCEVARPVNLPRSDRCHHSLYEKVLDDVCQPLLLIGGLERTSYGTSAHTVEEREEGRYLFVDSGLGDLVQHRLPVGVLAEVVEREVPTTAPEPSRVVPVTGLTERILVKATGLLECMWH